VLDLKHLSEQNQKDAKTLIH
jgi:hypothetical protein